MGACRDPARRAARVHRRADVPLSLLATRFGDTHVGHVALHGARVAAGTRTLFESISFEVAPGEFVAIVGPNGAGKTTLLRTIAGFVQPLAGEVHDRRRAGAPALGARNERAASPCSAAKARCRSARACATLSATGRFAHRDWWQWGEDASDRRSVDAALRHVDLEAVRRASLRDAQFGRTATRAARARTRARSRALVLVDEPTSHLDPRFAHEILSLLRSLAQGARSVVAVLHDLSQAAFADRVLVVADGRTLAAARAAVTRSIRRSSSAPTELRSRALKARGPLRSFRAVSQLCGVPTTLESRPGLPCNGWMSLERTQPNFPR